MKIQHLAGNIAGLTLAALSLLATPAATAETIISNETLVTTTFVVNEKPATARCTAQECRATVSMFAPIQVTCPAATGETCTFHILLDTKISIGYPLVGTCCLSGPAGFYQFLVDGAVPSIGPTAKNGDYLFEQSLLINGSVPILQNYPASVLATVTNSSSNSHTLSVRLGCQDFNYEDECEITAHSTTMRVDVFEP